MRTITRTAVLRTALRALPGPVALVPTMGALHAGHAALIRRARRAVGSDGTVVVSIFVNPTQFSPHEDLSRYPRPVHADQALCRNLGVTILFRPSVETIYPPGHSVSVDESSLAERLCGASRPGHFRGVCTVVTKLFNIVSPDSAIFGEKDFQQLAIIRRLVRDLHLPVRIIGHPTVREPDGLALSSRNTYLSPSERAAAPQFHAALASAASRKSPAAIRSAASRQISRIPATTIDYVEVVEANTLEPVTSLTRPARLVAAIILGRTRLIDNLPLKSTT